MSAPPSEQLQYRGVAVEDTFAEAFTMCGTRLIITAATDRWAHTAATVMCGYATSVIACDAEAGIERLLGAEETPDGRPGVAVLLFAFNADKLQQAVVNRVGQCVLTCPTTACFAGVPADEGQRIRIGGRLRYFGDGFQVAKKLGTRRYWRIPVMDGEFVCEDFAGTVKGVAGGNLLILGRTPHAALQAAQAAVDAVAATPDCITPFPGGIVRSGSKVGSRYPALNASTNDAYCPTLRAQTATRLPADARCVYEIVIDGLSLEAVRRAMRVALQAAAAIPDVCGITAGNYGGKLGPHHIHLRELLG